MPDTMRDFFHSDAEWIFKAAGIEPAEAPAMFKDVQAVLSQCMARLSVTEGLTFTRMQKFNDQKASLVEDLRMLKNNGRLV